MTACDNKISSRKAVIRIISTGEYLVFNFMPSEWAIQQKGWYNGGYGLFCLGKGYNKPMLMKKSWKHLLQIPDLSRIRALCESMGKLIAPHVQSMKAGQVYVLESEDLVLMDQESSDGELGF